VKPAEDLEFGAAVNVMLLRASTPGIEDEKILEARDRVRDLLCESMASRRYVHLGDYGDPQMFGRALAESMASALLISQIEEHGCSEALRRGMNRFRSEDPLDHMTSIFSWDSLEYLVEHGLPTMFVGEDLMRAISLTDNNGPGLKVQWSDIRFPYEAGLIMVPRRVIVAEHAGAKMHLSYLAYTRMHNPNVEAPSDVIDASEVDEALLDDGKLRVVGSLTVLGYWLCLPGNTIANTDGYKSAGLVVRLLELRDKDGKTYEMEVGNEGSTFYVQTGGPDSPPGTGSSKELQALSIKTTVLLLLAITARPHLLAPAYIQRRAKPKKHETAPREYWVPSIIGGDYVLPKAPPQGGTHASPRMHWRRGHYRRQACGPARRDHKIIWIEPMLVAAEPGEATRKPKTEVPTTEEIVNNG
jgi:hypothetical protein